jgi:hypothetical protein
MYESKRCNLSVFGATAIVVPQRSFFVLLIAAADEYKCKEIDISSTSVAVEASCAAQNLDLPPTSHQ